MCDTCSMLHQLTAIRLYLLFFLAKTMKLSTDLHHYHYRACKYTSLRRLQNTLFVPDA